MQLSPRHMVQRRFSTTAAALAVVSLLLGSAGAVSTLVVQHRAAPPSLEWSAPASPDLR